MIVLSLLGMVVGGVVLYAVSAAMFGRWIARNSPRAVKSSVDWVKKVEDAANQEPKP